MTGALTMTSAAPLELNHSAALRAPDDRQIDPAGRYARLRWDYVAVGRGSSREQVSLIASHDRILRRYTAVARRIHFDGRHCRALRDDSPAAVVMALPELSTDRYSRDGFVSYVDRCLAWLVEEYTQFPQAQRLFDASVRVYSRELDG